MNFVVNYYYIMYWCMITNNLKHNIHIMCTQFCIKLCKNTSVLLNIDRYQMSSAYVVFIIKCMRRKNIFSTAFVFFSLCYTRQKHLPCGLADKVIEYVALSTKTFDRAVHVLIPDRNVNTDLLSCSTKLFKGQKHNQAIVSSALACATR